MINKRCANKAAGGQGQIQNKYTTYIYFIYNFKNLCYISCEQLFPQQAKTQENSHTRDS